MSRDFKILLVGIVLVIELLAYLQWSPYSHGVLGGVVYRAKERIAATVDYHQHPSPATKAKFDEELRLMHQHEDWKYWANLAFVLVANVAGIYVFLKEDKRPTTEKS
jgi:hypothetical protein